MSSFFFFHDTATTEIYTLSLHDALPILSASAASNSAQALEAIGKAEQRPVTYGERGDWFFQPYGYARLDMIHDTTQSFDDGDRKSTRLNSSHSQISYAVFCLKKKKKE